MNISILGSGYVGLVSGACFAHLGHDVTCVDVDEIRVNSINLGLSPLHEPGLAELISDHVGQNLRATTDTRTAVMNSELTILAVPTPFDDATGKIELSFVLEAAAQVGGILRHKPGRHSVVVKSTVVPGTTDTDVARVLRESSGRADIGLGCNPEFLSESTAVEDFLRPDRIVLGGDDAYTLGLLSELHAPLGDVPTLRVSSRAAEMIKYASNALLATCVSFANEIAGLCESLGGVDVTDVMRGLHASRYLTKTGDKKPAPLASFLMAGCGFGGSCLPKDVAALAAHGKARDVPMPLMDAVLDVNRRAALRTVKLVQKHLPELAGRTVAVLGTAFKPGTADLRQSPAEPIIDELLKHGAVVVTHDPAANDATRRHFKSRVKVADAMEDAIEHASAVVIATAWPEFLKLRTGLPVVDGRRLLDPSNFDIYEGVGR